MSTFYKVFFLPSLYFQFELREEEMKDALTDAEIKAMEIKAQKLQLEEVRMETVPL